LCRIQAVPLNMMSAKGRHHLRRICRLIAAVLLFLSFFGSTDAEGFHHGWFVTTRPGWLWFTALVYCAIVIAGYSWSRIQ
jgi:hypothetical protein